MERRAAINGKARKRDYGPSFYVQMMERVQRKKDVANLLVITTALRLSTADLGRLFGVSRQAARKWLDGGVPIQRVADVSRVRELVDTLRKTFKAERLPSIVRAPLPGLDGGSILSVIAADGVDLIYDLLNRLKSWVPAA